MERTQRLRLDEVISASAAQVVIEVDDAGTAREATFDLTGLPRVEGLLSGRPVAEVPGIVERLCGICPAAHHLAGVAALDALHGVTALPDTATAVRRLLHLGANVANHALRLAEVDRTGAVTLARFAKTAARAAGSPGHFPVSAVPGGVRGPADAAAVAYLTDDIEEALGAATAIAATLLEDASPAPEDGFRGADAALVDHDGNPDPLGDSLRACSQHRRPVLSGVRPHEWPELVREARPGAIAPRPYLVPLGSERGAYRVGPVAQLRVGTLPTPVAARLQHRWLRDGGGARAARAVVTVFALELMASVLGDPALVAGTAAVPVLPLRAGTGTGWVDGPRGLLVHSYQAGSDGKLVSAQIMTPTAQNEPWLAALLRTAVEDTVDLTGDPAARLRLEDSIREADPCLPCSSAPAGRMDLRVSVVRSERGE